MKIILAEDNAVQRKVLTDVLRELGHEVEPTTNGAQAWDAWEEKPSDLLITDWDMPEMDGLELTRLIRSHPLGASTFIMMLSSIYTLKENVYQAMDAGVDDFMQEPYTKRDLMIRLRLAERHLSALQRIRDLEKKVGNEPGA